MTGPREGRLPRRSGRRVEGRPGSRYCARCPRSPMGPDGRRHLHELAPRDWFVVAGSDEPLQVLEVGKATVGVRTRGHQERVRFTEPGGRVRDFPASTRQTKRLAPTTEVFRLEAEGTP